MHDVARVLFWGGSRSTKPCVFPCKVAAAGDERYLVCAAVAGCGRFMRELVPPLCSATSGCVCLCSSMRFLNLWLWIALEWLRQGCMGYLVGRKPEHETFVFFRVKWLQATMQGTSLCAAGAAGVVSCANWFLLCGLQRVVVSVCVVLCVS